MSDFAFLFEKRRALSDRVVVLQSALAENPGDYALEKDLSSIHRLSKRYEEDILALSEQRRLGMLPYRIVPDNDGYSVSHVTPEFNWISEGYHRHLRLYYKRRKINCALFKQQLPEVRLEVWVYVRRFSWDCVNNSK